MPQLDILTFLPQFTWFAIFFTLFYFRVVTVFLPKIAETLKLRKKVKEQNTRLVVALAEETKQTTVVYEKILKTHLATVQKAIANDGALFTDIAHKQFGHLISTQGEAANTLYLEAVSDIVIGEFVVEEYSNPSKKEDEFARDNSSRDGFVRYNPSSSFYS